MTPRSMVISIHSALGSTAQSSQFTAEDDDRVTTGALIVEIDPRDYGVAVEQARAGLELAQARVASAKQDYAAALANIREDDAASFRAQRDAVRYAALLDQRVVAQEQYDQFRRLRW